MFGKKKLYEALDKALESAREDAKRLEEKTLDMARLEAALMEKNAKIVALENQNTLLEGKIAELEAKLTQFKKENSGMKAELEARKGLADIVPSFRPSHTFKPNGDK